MYQHNAHCSTPEQFHWEQLLVLKMNRGNTRRYHVMPDGCLVTSPKNYGSQMYRLTKIVNCKYIFREASSGSSRILRSYSATCSQLYSKLQQESSLRIFAVVGVLESVVSESAFVENKDILRAAVWSSS